MLRMIYQNPQRWLQWAVRFLAAIGLAWAYDAREAGRHAWIGQLGWAYWILLSPVWARPPLYILTDDLLVIHGLMGPDQRIPLALANAKRAGHGWLISWKAGKLPAGQEVRVPESFVTELQAAMVAAQAAGPRTPGIVRATNPASPGWYQWALGGATAFMVLAIAINRPMLLAPCYVLGVWSATWNQSYLLVGDQLLVLTGDRVAANIPLAQVQVSDETTLFTSHPQYPRLQLPKKAPTTPDFVRDLRGVQSGTFAPFGQALPPASAALDGPRCTLCGAHLPEAPAAHAADVVICPACADRTRSEAVHSGHGLSTAKPRPPM